MVHLGVFSRHYVKPKPAKPLTTDTNHHLSFNLISDHFPSEQHHRERQDKRQVCLIPKPCLLTTRLQKLGNCYWRWSHGDMEIQRIGGCKADQLQGWKLLGDVIDDLGYQR
jgi:hypothetical protein